MSFGGERCKSAHNRGEKRNRGRKEADIELTIQQFSTLGSWLSHRDLGDSGDPWWGRC